MGMYFEVYGRMVPEEEIRKVTLKVKIWAGPLFEGMKCWEVDLGGGLTAVFFYPTPGELKERLSKLEADPSPIIEGMEERWQLGGRPPTARPDPDAIPGLLRLLRTFVGVYERAFEKKTEWEIVPYNRPEPPDQPPPVPPTAERRHREPYILFG
jgi:hypothetical protein